MGVFKNNRILILWFLISESPSEIPQQVFKATQRFKFNN